MEDEKMKKVWFLVLGITALLFLAACSTGEASAKSRVCAQVSNCDFATTDDIAKLENKINVLSEKKLECVPTVAISKKEDLSGWNYPETPNELCNTEGKEAVSVLMSKKQADIGGWEIVNGFFPPNTPWNFDIDKGTDKETVYHVICCKLS